MRYIIITSLYYIWVCLYSLIFVTSNSIYLDATYFVIEDLFGVLLVYFLVSHRTPDNSLETLAAYGIILYKVLAIFSEFLLFFNLTISPKWWTIFAAASFFLNVNAWIALRNK